MSTQVRMNYHQKAQAHRLLEEHMTIKDRVMSPDGAVIEVWEFEEGWSDQRIAEEIGLERHHTVTNFRRELGFRTMLPPGAAPPPKPSKFDELSQQLAVALSRLDGMNAQLTQLGNNTASLSAKLTDVFKRLNDLEEVKTRPETDMPQDKFTQIEDWFKGDTS